MSILELYLIVIFHRYINQHRPVLLERGSLLGIVEDVAPHLSRGAIFDFHLSLIYIVLDEVISGLGVLLAARGR